MEGLSVTRDLRDPEVHLLSSSVVIKFNFEGGLHAYAKLPRSRLTGIVVPFVSDTALNVIREDNATPPGPWDGKYSR
jgi:hypothetical protein